MPYSVLDKIILAQVTVVPDTNAYTANDVIGGMLNFDLSGSSTGAGVINSLKVCDNDNEGAAGALWLFRPTAAGAAPSSIADNAAFAPSITDLENLLAVITLGTFTTVNSLKVNIVEDINNLFKTNQNIIYGYFVPSGGPSYAGSKRLTFELSILTQ